MACGCARGARARAMRTTRAGRSNIAVNWVAVDYLGTQPIILRGVSGMRYTFVPNMSGQIDGRDLEMMLETGLFRQVQP